jgi:hypothetical protein
MFSIRGGNMGCFKVRKILCKKVHERLHIFGSTGNPNKKVGNPNNKK